MSEQTDPLAQLIQELCPDCAAEISPSRRQQLLTAKAPERKP